MAVFVVVLGIFAVIALRAILRGFVLTMLWGWFLVPTFDLPELGIPVAIGISLVASFLIHQHIGTEEKTKPGQLALMILLDPLVALIVGAIVQMFM